MPEHGNTGYRVMRWVSFNHIAYTTQPDTKERTEVLLEDKNAVLYGGSKGSRFRRRKGLLRTGGEGRPCRAYSRDGRRQQRAFEERLGFSFVREIVVACYAREGGPSAKLLVLAAWLMVAMMAAGPVAAQGTAGAEPADPCPMRAIAEQYGAECGTPSEGADAARDAANDSWRAAKAEGGAKAFGEAVEAAGAGNASPTVAPSSSQEEEKEEVSIHVLPGTGGIPVLPRAGVVLLTVGGLLGFGTASRRRPHRASKRRGMG